MSVTGEQAMLWIGDYAAQGAGVDPNRFAIITAETGERLTYRELDRRIARAIALLRDEGLEPGDRFAYLGRNDAFYYVLVLAAARAGLLFVPLNWRCPAPEVAHFLADSDPKLLFADAEFQPVAAAALAPGARTKILSTRLGDAGDRTFVMAVEAPGEEIRSSVPKDDRGLLILYTSGTSGAPKGVVVTHHGFSLMRHMEIISPDFPEWRDETMVAGMPNFHVAGISWMFMGLMRQSTCVLTSDPSAANLTRLIRDHSAARTFAVPTVIRDIVDEVRRTGQPLPTLRMFLYGAMPIGETLLRDAMDTLGCSFLQYYGMTEISGSATFLAPRHHSLDYPELMQSVGLPFAGSQLEIRDEQGRQMPVGEAGEIYVRTPTLTPGYWRRPEATQAAIGPDGWYRTGDGGRLDESGFLYLTDRIKDMIITGGENVYPNEVEEVLIQHPAVQASAVVGRPDPRWGQAVVALVELVPGGQASAQSIIAFARERLAGFKCPKRVDFVPSLPRTASGKIRRQEARRLMLEQPDA